MSEGQAQLHSPFREALKRFWSDWPARIGTVGILLLLLPAVFAQYTVDAEHTKKGRCLPSRIPL